MRIRIAAIAAAGSLVLTGLFAAVPAQAADTKTDKSGADRVFYNGGQYPINAVATSGRRFTVPVGHKSSEYAQSTANVPTGTQYGGISACYHFWKNGDFDNPQGINAYGRSFIVPAGGPGDPLYVTGYPKVICP